MKAQLTTAFHENTLSVHNHAETACYNCRTAKTSLRLHRNCIGIPHSSVRLGLEGQDVYQNLKRTSGQAINSQRGRSCLDWEPRAFTYGDVDSNRIAICSLTSQTTVNALFSVANTTPHSCVGFAQFVCPGCRTRRGSCNAETTAVPPSF